jgi:O-antigen/teichoic acid export membrane protein
MTHISATVRRVVGQRFIRETMTLQVGQFVTIFVGGLTSIVIARILGPHLLGVYTLTVTMVAVQGLFDLSAATRLALVEVSRSLGAQDLDSIRDALAYCARINLTFDGVLFLLFFVLAPLIAQMVYRDAEIGYWARWLALPSLTDIPFQLLSITYQAQRHMRKLVIFEATKLVLSGLCMITLLLLGFGIPGLVISQIVVSSVYAVVSIYLYNHVSLLDPRFPSWAALIRRILTVGVRSRLFFGLRISLDKNLSTLLSQLPVLILGTVSQVQVGYFGTALRVITLPQPFIAGVARSLDTFLPFRAGQSQASLRSAFIQTTFVTGMIWAMITLALALVAPFILLLLYGVDYAPAIPMLFPLLLQSVAVGLGVGLGAAFRTLDKLGYSIAIQVVSLLVFAVIDHLLIQALGGYGAAWAYGAWFLAQTVIAIAVVLRLLNNAEQGSPRSTAAAENNSN